MMNQCVQDVFSGRLHTSYYLDCPFVEERARYLAQLLERGWARETVIGAAGKLVGFAKRVDINAAGGVTAAQIEAAADDWMKQPPHYFRREIGPRKARTRFVSEATNWLRFLGRLNELECSPAPHADLVAEFTHFLEDERGQSLATIRRRRGDALGFLNWFDQQQRPLSEATILDVERYLALPRPRPWSRVTVAGCVASLRSFFRYAGIRKWCASSIGEAIDAPRLYTLAGLPAGPSWTQVRQLITGIGQEQPADIRNRAIITLLAVYGFRSSEVCRLKLEDLDWERELILLSRTKQRREHQYPLVREVGEAILLYLRKARPQTDRREVFLRLLPPFEPLTVGGLGTMVHFRLKSLNLKLPHYGPHALRHACASHLLAEGLSLKEIGDHLGHSDPRSTRMYAKVDLEGLREVARFDLGGLL
jgi:site-specific recombinase XerD